MNKPILAAIPDLPNVRHFIVGGKHVANTAASEDAKKSNVFYWITRQEPIERRKEAQGGNRR